MPVNARALSCHELYSILDGAEILLHTETAGGRHARRQPQIQSTHIGDSNDPAIPKECTQAVERQW